jgi:hypothetical protein
MNERTNETREDKKPKITEMKNLIFNASSHSDARCIALFRMRDEVGCGAIEHEAFSLKDMEKLFPLHAFCFFLSHREVSVIRHSTPRELIEMCFVF